MARSPEGNVPKQADQFETGKETQLPFALTPLLDISAFNGQAVARGTYHSVTFAARTDYWAVATSRLKAREALKVHVAKGAVLQLVNRFLSLEQIAALDLRPRGFRKLDHLA